MSETALPNNNPEQYDLSQMPGFAIEEDDKKGESTVEPKEDKVDMAGPNNGISNSKIQPINGDEESKDSINESKKELITEQEQLETDNYAQSPFKAELIRMVQKHEIFGNSLQSTIEQDFYNRFDAVSVDRNTVESVKVLVDGKYIRFHPDGYLQYALGVDGKRNLMRDDMDRICNVWKLKVHAEDLQKVNLISANKFENENGEMVEYELSATDLKMKEYHKLDAEPQWEIRHVKDVKGEDYENYWEFFIVSKGKSKEEQFLNFYEYNDSKSFKLNKKEQVMYIEQVDEENLQQMRQLYKNVNLQAEKTAELAKSVAPGYYDNLLNYKESARPKVLQNFLDYDPYKQKEDTSIFDVIKRNRLPDGFQKKLEQHFQLQVESKKQTKFNVQNYTTLYSYDEKDYAIQAQFDNIKGAFLLQILSAFDGNSGRKRGITRKETKEGVQIEENIDLSLLEKIEGGSFTVIEDERFKTVNSKDPDFDPHWLNFKLDYGFIHFVSANTIGNAKSSQKLLTLNRYNFKTKKFTVDVRKRIDLKDIFKLTPEEWDDQDWILLPIRYLKQLHRIKDFEREYWILQIAKKEETTVEVKGNDNSQKTFILKERLTMCFRFDGRQFSETKKVLFPDAYIDNKPSALLVDKGSVRQAIPESEKDTDLQELRDKDMFIIVLDTSSSSNYLASVIYDFDSTEELPSYAPNKQEILKKFEDALELHKVDKTNTLVNMYQNSQCHEQHLDHNIANVLKQIVWQESRDLEKHVKKNLSQTKYSVLHNHFNGFMSVLISESEQTQGTEMYYFFKMRTLRDYYYKINKQKFSKYPFELRDNQMSSQKCIDVRRSYNESEWRLSDNTPCTKRQKVGRFIQANGDAKVVDFLDKLKGWAFNMSVPQYKMPHIVRKAEVKEEDQQQQVDNENNDDSIRKDKSSLKRDFYSEQIDVTFINFDDFEKDQLVIDEDQKLFDNNNMSDLKNVIVKQKIYKSRAWNKLQWLTFTYVEDDRDAHPFIFYNQDKGKTPYKDFAFWLVDGQGQRVEDTFIDFKIQPIKKAQIDLSYSSEVKYEPKAQTDDTTNDVDYLCQNFQAFILDQDSSIAHIFEIQVKYFADLRMSASLIGKKLLFFKGKVPRDTFFQPLMLSSLKDKQVQIFGTQFGKIQIPSPDMSTDDKDILKRQFDFVNQFTCTRVRKFEENYLIETFFRQELVQVAHLKDFYLLEEAEQDKDLKLQILNNSLVLALNSQIFSFALFMETSLLHKSNNIEEQQQEYIENDKYFQPSSLFNGRSMAEHFHDNEQIVNALNKQKQSRGEDFVKEIRDQQKSSIILFLQSPLEQMITEWGDSKISQLVKAGTFIQRSNVYFNFNMESTLLVLLRIGGVAVKEAFEQLVINLQSSFLPTSLKRKHLMSVLHYVCVEFQNLSNQKTTFDCILDFLDEYQEPEKTEEQPFNILKTIEYQQPVDLPLQAYMRYSNRFKKEKFFHHSSKVFNYPVSHDEMIEAQGDLEEQESPETLYSLTQYYDLFYGNTYRIKSYFICFKDFNYARAIHTAVDSGRCDNKLYNESRSVRLEKFKQAKFSIMTEDKLANFADSMLQMQQRSNYELDDVLVIRDLIDYQYENKVQCYFIIKHILYFAYLIPIMNVMLGGVDHTTPQGLEACLIISIIVQVMFLGHEIIAVIGGCKSRQDGERCCKDSQNFWDIFVCIYAIFYCVLRLREIPQCAYSKNCKKGEFNGRVYYNHDKVDNYTLAYAKSMHRIDHLPILGAALVFLTFMQWQFYMKSVKFLNKQIKLMYKGIYDALGFLLMFALSILLFMIMFTQIGAKFDDGDNYGSDYQTDFNDYPNISPGWTMILANTRTAVGDLQPPTYDYWSGRYNITDAKGVRVDRNVATFYIIVIWVLWVIKIFIMVILMLNFMIAIVSDSFNYIMENERLQTINGNIEFAEQYSNDRKLFFPDQAAIYGLSICATIGDAVTVDQWSGLTRSIKRHINELEVIITESQQRIAYENRQQTRMLEDADQARQTFEANLKESLTELGKAQANEKGGIDDKLKQQLEELIEGQRKKKEVISHEQFKDLIFSVDHIKRQLEKQEENFDKKLSQIRAEQEEAKKHTIVEMQRQIQELQKQQIGSLVKSASQQIASQKSIQNGEDSQPDENEAPEILDEGQVTVPEQAQKPQSSLIELEVQDQEEPQQEQEDADLLGQEEEQQVETKESNEAAVLLSPQARSNNFVEEESEDYSAREIGESKKKKDNSD